MGDIYFKCGCGKNLAVDARGAGRMVNCPNCGTRFMIPEAMIEWVCPRCAASMLAPEEMRGMWVQCVNCQSEVRVPEADDRENNPQAGAPAEIEGPQAENLAANLNQLFKDCPQCHERIPIRTRQCPYCEHLFSKRAPRGIVTGALCVVIAAGIFLGLWQAGIWPFASVPPAPPAPPVPRSKPAAPVPQAKPATPPDAKPVASAPVQTAITTTVKTEITAPAASPGPTNTVSTEAWLSRLEISRQLIVSKTDKTYPWCSLNQFVSLRQIDGLMVRGTNAGAGAAGVNLIVAGKPALITFQNLDANDRLKVDDKFRSTWIDAQAAALSRKSLEQEGFKLPGFSSNDVDALDQALALGDPQAQYQLGQQYYKQQDYAYAFLYLQAAAAQNHAPAQYALGMICYQGIGVEADKKEGLKWLALAAAQGHAKAEQFIRQHKISPETRQKLVKREQAQKERESQEQAQALKAYRSRSQSPDAGRPVTVEP